MCYWQCCSFDEPNWKCCSEKQYEMYENLPMFKTRINPEIIKKETSMSDHVINVSKDGRFEFEINRVSDKNDWHINEFVGKLRDNYPVKDGYRITVYKRISGRNKTEI